jgi:hypothetical protein
MAKTPAPAAPEAAVFIKAREVTFSRVGAAALRTDSANEVDMDTVRGRYLLIRNEEQTHFYYRAALTDTVWTEVALDLPTTDGVGNDLSWENSQTALHLRNLDHRGAPEVLITSEASAYGTAGGTRWVCINLFDVSHTPLLLLSGLVEEEDENFGRDDSQPDGRRTDAGYERYTGWRRAIALGGLLRVGPAEPIGAIEPIAQHNGECSLTPLVAGRYRYVAGGLRRVGK